MFRPIIRHVLVIQLVSLAGLVPAPALAQTMSFSVYTDPASGSGYVYVSSSVLDNSSGCSHWGYLTTAKIYSPSSRSAQSTNGGLSASTSLSLSGEFGTYTTVTTGSYNCSCIFGGLASYGGGQPIVVPKPVYANPYNSLTDRSGTPASCSTAPYYWKVRDIQVEDGSHSAIQRVMTIGETFANLNPNPNCFGVNLAIGGGPTQQNGTFRDNLYLCGSPTCNGGGSCSFSRDQTFSADGETLAPTFTQTYTCSTASVTP